MSPSMTVLKLEGEAGDWRLRPGGDWSLAAMAKIEAAIQRLPGTLHGTLAIDWSGAEAPGIGPVWALLMRLKGIGTQLENVRHMDYLADVRWGGPLGEVLQDPAVQELHAHANLRNVSAEGSVFASGYWLEFEVADFQAEYTSAGASPVVRVRVLARIGTSGDRHILGQFGASAQRPAAENRLSAIMDAYARASDAAFAEIAVHAGELLAASSEAR